MAEYHNSEPVKIARRPNLSATCANAKVPKNNPAKVKLPKAA
jgi:hypothetical protein